MHNVVLD